MSLSKSHNPIFFVFSAWGRYGLGRGPKSQLVVQVYHLIAMGFSGNFEHRLKFEKERENILQTEPNLTEPNRT